MPRIDRDTLRREQEADQELEKSFNNNPVKAAIQELFHKEFSGSNYRKLGGLAAVKELAIAKIKESTKGKSGPWSSGAMNLEAKIKKATSYEDMLMAMNDYLFS